MILINMILYNSHTSLCLSYTFTAVYQTEKNISNVHKQKSVEPVLMLVPRSKDSRIAQSVETSNAESPTPMYIHQHYQATEAS